ncbi:hypothetical protein KI387_016787, partial [Taxus chinensis]
MEQKYTRDADQPVWHKSVHFGRFRDICPRQSKTVGTKVHGGRELADSAETGDFHPIDSSMGTIRAKSTRGT